MYSEYDPEANISQTIQVQQPPPPLPQTQVLKTKAAQLIGRYASAQPTAQQPSIKTTVLPKDPKPQNTPAIPEEVLLQTIAKLRGSTSQSIGFAMIEFANRWLMPLLRCASQANVINSSCN
jgi:hypothetical protein